MIDREELRPKPDADFVCDPGCPYQDEEMAPDGCGEQKHCVPALLDALDERDERIEALEEGNAELCRLNGIQATERDKARAERDAEYQVTHEVVDQADAELAEARAEIEALEEGIAAQDKILTDKYNDQLARAETAEARLSAVRAWATPKSMMMQTTGLVDHFSQGIQSAAIEVIGVIDRALQGDSGGTGGDDEGGER